MQQSTVPRCAILSVGSTGVTSSEAARVHIACRRCGGRVAAHGGRAAADDAGGRIPDPGEMTYRSRRGIPALSAVNSSHFDSAMGPNKMRFMALRWGGSPCVYLSPVRAAKSTVTLKSRVKSNGRWRFFRDEGEIRDFVRRDLVPTISEV